MCMSVRHLLLDVLNTFYNPILILIVFFSFHYAYSAHACIKYVKQLKYALRLNSSALRENNKVVSYNILYSVL